MKGEFRGDAPSFEKHGSQTQAVESVSCENRIHAFTAVASNIRVENAESLVSCKIRISRKSVEVSVSIGILMTMTFLILLISDGVTKTRWRQSRIADESWRKGTIIPDLRRQMSTFLSAEVMSKNVTGSVRFFYYSESK